MRMTDIDQFGDVPGEFEMRAVDTFALLSGQLDLGARLDSDASGTALEGEHMAFLFVLNLPAEAVDQLAEHGLDAVGAGIRHGAASCGVNRDFFVSVPTRHCSRGFAPLSKYRIRSSLVSTSALITRMTPQKGARPPSGL